MFYWKFQTLRSFVDVQSIFLLGNEEYAPMYSLKISSDSHVLSYMYIKMYTLVPVLRLYTTDIKIVPFTGLAWEWNSHRSWKLTRKMFLFNMQEWNLTHMHSCMCTCTQHFNRTDTFIGCARNSALYSCLWQWDMKTAGLVHCLVVLDSQSVSQYTSCQYINQ